MAEILSKCGYRCDLCAAYDTNLKREEDKIAMSRAFKQYFDFSVSPEDIKPCKGCQAAEKTPDESCLVYPCVMERGLENCGQCDDFGCDKLKSRMDVVEEILQKHKDIPDKDYELYFVPYLSRKNLISIREQKHLD